MTGDVMRGEDDESLMDGWKLKEITVIAGKRRGNVSICACGGEESGEKKEHKGEEGGRKVT